MPRRSKGPRLYLRERQGRPAVYVILDGKNEVSTGFGSDDFSGADEAFRRYCAATFRPNTGERDLARIPCAEVLTMYARDQPPDKPSKALIGYHIRALLPFWGDKTLADVKGSTCREYSTARTTSKSTSNGTSKTSLYASRPLVRGSTVRRELKTLQAAINHWHKESPLAAVPKVTLPPESERRERVLERSEVAKLLLACRKLSRTDILMHNGAKMRRDYMFVARFILIGYNTGTRHNAILNLRWEPALSGGHIDLARGILYRRGAGERETSKRRPVVAIPRRLRHFLQRWERKDSDQKLSHVITNQGARVAKMKRAWATVVKAAGLGKDVTPHTLRHTCASWLLWQGKTIWDVAGIIGADATTVQKVYGHHRKIEQDERKRA